MILCCWRGFCDQKRVARGSCGCRRTALRRAAKLVDRRGYDIFCCDGENNI